MALNMTAKKVFNSLPDSFFFRKSKFYDEGRSGPIYSRSKPRRYSTGVTMVTMRGALSSSRRILSGAILNWAEKFVTAQKLTKILGDWQGAYEGWLPTRKALAARIKKALPGIAGFYMCGQWVEPGGGVPVSIISGRNVIKMIRKQDRKNFSTREQAGFSSPAG